MVSHRVPVDIDDAPLGVMVYDAAGVPLGVVRVYLQMNGNGPPKARRRLDNGKWADRYDYRREILYRNAKAAGPVFIAATTSEVEPGAGLTPRGHATPARDQALKEPVT